MFVTLMKILKDITTGIDGESYDVVKVAMSIMIMLLPLVLIWALSMHTWAVLNDKTFDLVSVFNAILAFLAGVGTFLMSGSAAILFKKSTEPTESSTSDLSNKEVK